MQKIVALTGAKGCGKDTTASILHHSYHTIDRPVLPIAFADPIKNEVMRIFGLNTIEEYDSFKRSTLTTGKFTVSGRQVVREIGMLMRGYDVNQFVEYVDEKINSNPNTIWIITDLRFDNEMIHLKNLGAKVVKIERPMIDMIDTHITERGFDNTMCDIIIQNKSTLEEFTNDVLTIFDKKLKEWNWV